MTTVASTNSTPASGRQRAGRDPARGGSVLSTPGGYYAYPAGTQTARSAVGLGGTYKPVGPIQEPTSRARSWPGDSGPGPYRTEEQHLAKALQDAVLTAKQLFDVDGAGVMLWTSAGG
jgi:hypothetical protein